MRVVKGLLERSVATVETLTAAPAGMRLSDLARALDMPKTAAHRLLAELLRLGWVERAPAEVYRLAPRLPLMAQRVLHATGLTDRVQPVLDRVARDTRELARAAVALPDSLVWLAQAQGAPPGLLYQPTLSDAVRPHATANGKAWLATFERARAIEIARAGGLGTIRPTRRTLTSEAALLRDLAAVRARGFAVAEEEAEPGVVAIAVAVMAGHGPAVATVSVAGPLVRLPESRRAAVAARLRQAADELAVLWPASTTVREARA
jgi:DNA-binding IclR family transcriptional regulator